MNFFPSVESDKVSINVEFPPGFPAEKTFEIVKKIQKKGVDLLKEIDQEKGQAKSSLKHVYTQISSQSRRSPSATTTANIRLLLLPDTERSVSTIKFAKLWQKSVKSFPEVRSIAFQSRRMHFGGDIKVLVSHQDPIILRSIVEEIKLQISEYKGTKEIKDSETEGNHELQFKLTQQAAYLGLTPSEFARILRSAFSGREALKIQKEKEEIPVLIIYPAEYRENINKLGKVQLTAPSGGKISIEEAATIKESVEPVSIRRVDRKRVIEVTASVEKTEANLEEIMASIQDDYLPELRKRYPDLNIKLEGSSKERTKSMKSLMMGFLTALVAIYALLAIFFRSYTQPLLVMTAIPFGIAGAVFGHLILGYSLSFLSFFSNLSICSTKFFEENRQ